MKKTARKDDYLLLLTTTNRIEEAHRMADHLVAAGLVACVNIIPSIFSIYLWKGAVQKDNEVLMILKTKKSKIGKLQETFRKIHGYETPELIACRLEYGLPEYLRWIDDSLAGRKSNPKS